MVSSTAPGSMGVGIIGCGNISGTYLANASLFKGLDVRAVADLRHEMAEEQARKYGVEAAPVDVLLSRDDVDIVVNLTQPSAHASVSLAALAAGKHVFSEKPLAASFELGRTIVAEADKRRLLIGCAPDTFLGAAGRHARRLIDDGAIGKPLSGTAFIMSHGMEHWHPDPEFFFKPGGGPVLDMGPYYISTLVNLLGPVARVLALTGTGFGERVVTTEGRRKGNRINVEVATTALALLQFAGGAQVMFGASWDVWRHSHPPLEIYGEKGSMRVPDPNFFAGEVEITESGGEWQRYDTAHLPLGAANWPADTPHLANYRALGVAELASAVRNGTPHRTSGRFALHVLEVLEAIVAGGEKGAVIEITSTVRQPAPFTDQEIEALRRR